MFDLVKTKEEFSQISHRLATEHDLDNNNRAQLQKEAFELSRLIEKAEAVQLLKQQLEECDQMLQGDDQDMAELAAEERVGLLSELDDAQVEFDDVLFPPDPNDSRSIFLEVRPAAGGQEASIFVGDLFKMYSAYAVAQGWKVTINSLSTTDAGGAREIIAFVSGKGVYGKLKHESGVHRVQRVPTTETAGRIHTSTATVVVIPEADEVEVSIDPSQVRVDVYRASGAGGQHVNTTDSAVRLTHIPSGLVVTCQDERSQLKNKNKAMKELRARLYAAQREKAEQEASSERKDKMGSGDRSEKIRTYNYPQNRITDHRIGLTLKKLDIVMQGEIGEIVQALKRQEKSQE